jgi:hypothetical protein
MWGLKGAGMAKAKVTGWEVSIRGGAVDAIGGDAA